MSANLPKLPDLAQWLETLGLAEYLPVFQDNHIELGLLPSLTAEDLREIGIVSVGHRRRLLDALKQLEAQEGDVARTPPKAKPAAQWRPITLIYCDLVGSTALAESIDPEELRLFIANFRATLTRVIQKYQGTVAQYLGDGIVACFGYPQVFGYDAERAVRAGLEILVEIANLPPLEGQQVQVRIGAATGHAIIGQTRDQGGLTLEGAIGAVPILAAHVQAVATPGSLVIAASTHRLLGQLFECRDLGSFKFKGIAKRVPIWQVLGERNAKSRFEAMRIRHAELPMVGRDHEVALLSQRLAVAKQGQGQIVVVIGESGMGKSRLVKEAFSAGSRGDGEPLILQCTPFYRSSAFHPLRTYFERALQLGSTEASNQGAAARLQAFLAGLWPTLPEEVVLLCEFLAIAPPESLIKERSNLDDLNPTEKRMRTIRALLAFLQAMAARAPVFVIEDIHWMDPSSHELMASFVKIQRHLPILMVATMRSGHLPDWLSSPHVRTLTLERLFSEDVRQLVAAMAAPEILDMPVLDAIVERSDGVPIFAEELTRGYIEQEVRGPANGLEPADIPSTLTGSLLARLDGLEFGRHIACTASVLTREFPVPLLLAASPQSEAETRLGLHELLNSGVLVPGHSRFGETLAFRHSLVRDAAYQLLLRKDRMELHRKVAHIIETQFADVASTIPFALAYQWERGGELVRAATEWERAGNLAAKRSDYGEAIVYFKNAIAANARLEPDLARDEREMTYRLALVTPLVAANGFGGSGVSDEIEIATRISRRLGKVSQIVPALTVKWGGLGNIVSIDSNLELARQIYDLSQSGAMLDRLLGLRVLGTSLFFKGAFREALTHLMKVMELYVPQRDDAEIFRVGPSNQIINTMIGIAQTLAIMDDPEGAHLWQKRCLDKAEEIGEVNPQFNALVFGGCLTAYIGQDDSALGYFAAKLHDLLLSHDLPFWRGHTHLFAGIALVLQGRNEEGFRQALAGIEQLDEVRAFSNAWPILLADAAVRYGRPDICEAMLTRSQSVRHQGYMYLGAEFHRIRGRLHLLKEGDVKRAHEQFKLALELATGQGASRFARNACQEIENLKAMTGKRMASKQAKKSRSIRNLD
ncbi:MAG: AAA family ATPase [Hyphomicrobiales bacterium]|nr:AAA family ATPase [Hyphomicrobiales bacterium]MDE2113534.1 AAA family ATPase [Hyphomicrobiales bacterium]